MPDYKTGKIYRIVCNITGEQYIGSTVLPLSRRLAHHKAQLKNQTIRKCRSMQIIERGDYEIVLIEDCHCESKEQLLRRERHFVELMTCVNKQIPGRSGKEYRTDNRDHILERQKEYYNEHRDAVRQQQNEYKKLHRPQQLEYYKAYKQRIRDEDPEAFRQRNREYYAENKERICIDRKAYRDRLKAEVIEASLQHQVSPV